MYLLSFCVCACRSFACVARDLIPSFSGKRGHTSHTKRLGNVLLLGSKVRGRAARDKVVSDSTLTVYFIKCRALPVSSNRAYAATYPCHDRSQRPPRKLFPVQLNPSSFPHGCVLPLVLYLRSALVTAAFRECHQVGVQANSGELCEAAPVYVAVAVYIACEASFFFFFFFKARRAVGERRAHPPVVPVGGHGG